jgi:hypothetical protein
VNCELTIQDRAAGTSSTNDERGTRLPYILLAIYSFKKSCDGGEQDRIQVWVIRRRVYQDAGNVFGEGNSAADSALIGPGIRWSLAF